MPQESTSKATDIVLKVVIGALLAMCAWYLQELTDDIDELRESVTRLRIAVEVQAGGNPFDGAE